MTLNKALTFIITLFVSNVIYAAAFDFSYGPKNGEIKYWGSKKAEAYDIAIRLNNDVFEDCSIKGISVIMPEDIDASETSAWITSELTLEESVNVPNLRTCNTLIEDGLLTATFDQPYVLKKGDDIFVGYSFIVNSNTGGNSTPVAVYSGNYEDGLWVHTSKTTTKWRSLASSNIGISALTLHMDGPYGNFEYCVGVQNLNNAYAQKGEHAKVSATIVNLCDETIDEIEIEYHIGDLEPQVAYCNLNGSLEPRFGATTNIDFVADLPEEFGTYPLTVSIKDVNGQKNYIADIFYNANATVVSFLPIMRPLCEEYTGLWCGYCPRGYVAMELLSNWYEDRFIGLAYHNSDEMAIFSTGEYPSYVNGYPKMVMNRDIHCDPYYGLYQTGNMAIDELWDELSDIFAIADINVELKYTDDSHNKVLATTETVFAGDVTGDFRIAYVLLADGLHNEKWYQANLYGGETELSDFSDLWDVFTNTESGVTDLIYNDVVIYYNPDEFLGVPESLPQEITGNVAYTHQYEISLDKCVNIKNDNILSFSDYELKVVAIIFNGETGEFINCNKSSKIYGEASINTIDSEEILKTEYYDLTGNLHKEPVKGINLKVDHLSNGSIKTQKIIY